MLGNLNGNFHVKIIQNFNWSPIKSQIFILEILSQKDTFLATTLEHFIISFLSQPRHKVWRIFSFRLSVEWIFKLQVQFSRFIIKLNSALKLRCLFKN